MSWATHGSGVVMSPVTQKSAEGLPIFYLKDIPNRCSGSQTSADSLGESLGWLVLNEPPYQLAQSASP